MNYQPRHRAFRATAKTRAHRLNFQPRHCAGQTCVHNHADEPRPLGTVSGRLKRTEAAA